MEFLLILVLLLVGFLTVKFEPKRNCTECGKFGETYRWMDGQHLCDECDEKRLYGEDC